MSAITLIKTFEKELNLTEKGLIELAESKKGLVFDVSTDAGFKAARKEKNEQNTWLKDIDRLAIDSKTSIDDARKELKSKVEKIYLPTVNAFDNEDAKRKEEKRLKEEAEQERVLEIKKHIEGISDNAKNLHGKSSDEISAIIEAVDLIDVSEFFAEFTTDAMAAIKLTLSELNLALSYAIQNEQLKAEQDKLKAERDEMDKDKAEFEAFKKSKRDEESRLDAEREKMRIQDDIDKKALDIELSSNGDITSEMALDLVPAPDLTKVVAVEKMVTITDSEYQKLIADSNLLEALKAAGVDNWIDYSVAQDILEEMVA